MEKKKTSSQPLSDHTASEIERLSTLCQEKFYQIFSFVKNVRSQDAYQIEVSVFKNIMQLGFLLLKLFFASHNAGDYGETIKTARGTAQRGRLSEKSYFSIFGKLKIKRYLYHLGKESFAPLDIVLNLPSRCYSYFLSEWVNHLNIKDAYEETGLLLKKFFGLSLSVAAVETITQDSATECETYYEFKKSRPDIPPDQEQAHQGELTVVGFDGKGVPMIKQEAAKIKGRQGKGEKRQKKKEALVGVKYTIEPEPRTAEEVARNLVYPEHKKHDDDEATPTPTARAQNMRYIASLKKPKREVMREISQAIETQSFGEQALICLIDGARSLERALKEVFNAITNKVIIVDIIHVLEYIWLIAHLKYAEGTEEVRQYVFKTLLSILQGKVVEYIKTLQHEVKTGNWKTSQRETFTKVITYLKNHHAYMKYDEYLTNGYPIATGVVESACGHIVKDRMELSGARWSIDGAEAMLRVRSIVKSQDWDDYWKFYMRQFRDNTFLEIEDHFLDRGEEKLA